MFSGPDSSTGPHNLLYIRAVRTGYFSHTQSFMRLLEKPFLNTTSGIRTITSIRHIFPPIYIWEAPELESRDMAQNSPLRFKKQSRSTLNTPSTMSLRRDLKH